MGAAFCILFAWWFVSGIFMMYTDFPAESQDDRIRHASIIDPSSVRIDPAEAWARLGLPNEPRAITLGVFAGRPVYRFSLRAANGHSPEERLVYADDGTIQEKTDQDLLLRVAREWAHTDAAPEIQPVTAPDQWTIEGSLRRTRPLWRYSFPDGQQVYISGSDGKVVQYTTAASRFLAYLGPIPHWLYYTPLRVRQKFWSRVIIWSSAACTLVALLGL